jgi:chromosome segregation ATPase
MLKDFKKITGFAFLLLAFVLHTGHGKLEAASANQGASEKVVERFSQGSAGNHSVVESAMALTDKYAALSEEAAALREKNRVLTEDNAKLKEQLMAAESKLQRYQRDTADANSLITGMRVELNNWKTNVLGFRDEIRDAQKAQLEALFKILNLLGGEAKTDTAHNEKMILNNGQTSEPNQANTQRITVAGK